MAFTIKHFSLNMPKGKGQSNIPELLRRLAAEIENEGDIYIQDITFHIGPDEGDTGEEWPMFTVYYDDK